MSLRQILRPRRKNKLQLSVLITLLIIATALVSADTSFIAYSVRPTFTHTLSYNILDDYAIISAGAKDIIASCAGAPERSKCIDDKIVVLDASGLSWYRDSCPSDTAGDTFFREVTGLLQECKASERLTCSCGYISFPRMDKVQLQLVQSGTDIVATLVRDGKPLKGFKKTISDVKLQEYEMASGKYSAKDNLVLSGSSCEDKGYCVKDIAKDSFILDLVGTPQGVAFLKSDTYPSLPYCEVLSPFNKFEMCVEGGLDIDTYYPPTDSVMKRPLTYHFALVVGPEKSVVKGGIGSPGVIAEIEKQIANPEFVFDSAQERETWREYVLASAYIEGRFTHFDASRASGIVEGHDSNDCQSIGYGAMQITDSSLCPNDFHPDCFGRGGNGVCSASPECAGKTALDLSCNVAAGVRYHYRNYMLAKEELHTTYANACGGELDAFQLALKFYNGGYGDSGGCSYPGIAENYFQTIFE